MQSTQPKADRTTDDQEAARLKADIELNRLKSCPHAQQRAIDKLTAEEAQLRMLTREAVL